MNDKIICDKCGKTIDSLSLESTQRFEDYRKCPHCGEIDSCQPVEGNYD